MLELEEREEVNRIVSDLETAGYLLRDLIHLIVESERFLAK